MAVGYLRLSFLHWRECTLSELLRQKGTYSAQAMMTSRQQQ